jgi:cell division protein FtsB
MAVLCVYFSFYLMFGPRGYFALQHVQEQLVEKNAEFAVLKDKRDHLDSDVHLMRPDSLDPDMADEQARKNLGYMKPDEVVIDLN